MRKTQVYLIGAGAGDPELITQKACRALQLADVVLYDYLVHPNIVMMATQAQKICVGKKKGAHSTQQPGINALLVAHAKKGQVVARLKGGDPMIFGRCGEEMAALFSEGIPYEIIPGITSAISRAHMQVSQLRIGIARIVWHLLRLHGQMILKP